MNVCARSARNGFTIVEALVAMTVTAIGLLAVLGALRSAAAVADRVRDERAAQLLAEQRMTALLVRPLQQMGTRSGQEGAFEWQEQVRTSRLPQVAEVVVTIRWRQQGQARHFQLASLKEIPLVAP